MGFQLNSMENFGRELAKLSPNARMNAFKKVKCHGLKSKQLLRSLRKGVGSLPPWKLATYITRKCGCKNYVKGNGSQTSECPATNYSP